MSTERIYDKLKSKIGEANSFLSQMSLDIVENKTIDDAVQRAMQSYLHTWYAENSTKLYVDDVISISVSDDAYSTAILIENDDGTYTAFINDGAKEVKKFTGVEDVSFDPSTLDFVLSCCGGKEIYNFRPPSEVAQDANGIVGYIINPDGRITYYMADGSCVISHEFEYEDGVIEYIECEICGDMALFQVRFINYTWKEQYEMIYYDNYIERRDYNYHWHDYYEVNEDVEEFNSPLSMIMIWYRFFEDYDLVYQDNHIDRKEISYTHYDVEAHLEPIESSHSFTATKTYYDEEKSYVSFGYPIFWAPPTDFLPCEELPPKDRPDYSWNDGSSPDFIPGEPGAPDTDTDESFEPVDRPVEPPPIEPSNPDAPIFPVKLPIQKVLGCQREEEGLRVTFGDRSWLIPYNRMNITNTSCDTSNYGAYVDQETGFLMLELPACGMLFPLGKATEFDGEDGIDTIEFTIEDTLIYQTIIEQGETEKRRIMGDLRYPHVKEAFISDKRDLVFRDEQGTYTITGATYPNNNGNMGMFPYFKVESDETGKNSVVGHYYYDNEAFKDITITLDYSSMSGGVTTNNRSFRIENGFIVYDVDGTESRYRIPTSSQYMGVTDIELRNDELIIENGYYDITRSTNKLSTEVSTLSVVDNDLTFELSVNGETEAHTLTFPVDLTDVDGKPGTLITDVVNDEGMLIISNEETVFLESSINATLPSSIINNQLEGVDRFNMSRTEFYIGQDPIILTQPGSESVDTRSKNWLSLGYTFAFNGQRGRAYDRSVFNEDDGQVNVTLMGTDLSTKTLDEYGRTDSVIGIDTDPTKNKIFINYADGSQSTLDFKLRGRNSGYIGSIFNVGDSIYVEVSNRPEPTFVGIISNFEGKPPRYPTDMTIDGRTFHFDMPDEVLDIDIYDVIKNRGKRVETIDYLDNFVTITGDDGSILLEDDLPLDAVDAHQITKVSRINPNTLRWQTDDQQWQTTTTTIAKDSVYLDHVNFIRNTEDQSKDDIIFRLSNGTHHIIPLERNLRGDDGVSIESFEYVDNTLSYDTNYDTDFTLSVPIDGKDGVVISSLYYSDGSLSYSFSDGTTGELLSSDKVLDGKDATFIENVDFTDRKLVITTSEETLELLDSIDGLDTDKGIVDVSITDDGFLTIEHLNGTIVTSTSPMLTDFKAPSFSEDKLTLSFEHDDFTTSNINGEDFADGLWITDIVFDSNSMSAEWNDGTTTLVGNYNAYELIDIRIVDNHLELESSQGVFRSPNAVVAMDAERVIDDLSVVNGRLTITFTDDQVWDVGNVRGNASTRNTTSMYLDQGKLYGITNNTTTYGGVDVDGNFGFGLFNPLNEYRRHDGVVSSGTLYVRLDSNGNESPSPTASTWGKVLMVDEESSIVASPSAIETVIDGSLATLVGSDMKTLYSGVEFEYRHFQVRIPGTTWENSIIDTTSTGFTLLVALDENQYEWRCRDKAMGQDTLSAWSNIQEFEISNERLNAPTLTVDDVSSINPTFTLTGVDDFDMVKWTLGDLTITTPSNSWTPTLGTMQLGGTYHVVGKFIGVNVPDEWSDTMSLNPSKVNLTKILPTIQVDSPLTIPVISAMIGDNLAKILKEINVTSDWVVVDENDNILSSYRSKLDIVSVKLKSDAITPGEVTRVKVRYASGAAVTQWSNTVTFIPTETLSKPTITINRVSGKLDYRLELTASNRVDHSHTRWEFFDNDMNQILYVDYSDVWVSEYVRRLPPSWANQTVSVRAKMFNTSGVASEWSDLVSFTATPDSTVIAAPFIKDYFVHDFGLALSGNSVIVPSAVQYEVTDLLNSDVQTFDAAFDAINNRIGKTVKVPHTNFEKGRLYSMRARQFHSATGWSEWSPSEQFGFDFVTAPGTFTMTVPDGIEEISAVAVSSGGGGDVNATLNRTGWGGSLNYIPKTPNFTKTLTGSVGRGSSSSSGHGEDSYITDLVFAPKGRFVEDGVTESKCGITSILNYGGRGNARSGGGAAGYLGKGGNGGQPSPTGESGSGGMEAFNADYPGRHGGDISILGSTIRDMDVEESGGDVYPEIPKAGGGAGSGPGSYIGSNGGVGVLYGILKYPLGITAPWNEDYQ